MHLEELSQQMLPAIESELRMAVALAGGPYWVPLHEMLVYHMGWAGSGVGPAAQGKRIRPLVVLLSASACGGDWRRALPAAAWAELIHNFSLIHDDIEDSSPTRRGRPTLWSLHGIPQAINTGDALFAVASLARLDLEKTCSPESALRAFRIAHQTTLDLTKGQFLDMSYENLRSLPLEAYWPMIKGKTAALLAACPELGALVAGADSEHVQSYRVFGQNLGLAFQVQDDILGIRGAPEVTGKSAAIDLLNGKKSLPVLYGLQQNGPFAKRWLAGSLHESEILQLAEQLAREGALDYAQTVVGELTAQALTALTSGQPQGDAGQALYELASHLLQRQL